MTDAEMRSALERAEIVHRLDRTAIDRWVPCPDHRDKTTRGLCYVCDNERLRRVIRRLVDRLTADEPPSFHWDNAADMAALIAAEQAIADGRSFA